MSTFDHKRMDESMGAELKRAILQRCKSMEIPLVGMANVERWNDPPFLPWIPEEFYPQSIYPDARSVIVIGIAHFPSGIGNISINILP